MKRIIGDKLNFLMQVTETRNNILGKAIAFDPSYISRIRTGSRGVPKHRDFIYPAAAFFAQAVQTKEQKEKLAEAGHINRFILRQGNRRHEAVQPHRKCVIRFFEYADSLLLRQRGKT